MKRKRSPRTQARPERPHAGHRQQPGAGDIVIRGAREHNLREIDLRLPRNKLICMTGVSGSGKSSLAFDTLYAEGQRRYVESLSSYARQFLGQMPKPAVDAISGLAPSISIQQKSSGRNPRSTVGTITEIYDYLRVLYARVGQGFCPRCGREITAQTVDQIVETIAQLPTGARFLILSPLIQQQKGEYRDLFDDLLKQGFLRARVDGRLVQLTDDLKLDRQMRHTIEVVVDRLVSGQTSRSRLAEAIELALKLSGGTLIVSQQTADSPGQNTAGSDPSMERTAPEGKSGGRRKPRGRSAQANSTRANSTIDDRLFSSRYACTHCGVSYEPPSPQLFSFNSPLGMCLECNGLGMRHEFVHKLLIPNEKLSVNRGAVELLGPLRQIGRWRRHIFQGAVRAIEKDLQLAEDSLLKTPWRDLPQAARHQFLYGTGDRHVTFAWRFSGGVWKHGGTYPGVIPQLLEKYRTTRNPMRRRQLEKYMQFVTCTECGGSRLNRQARHVRMTSNSRRYASRGGSMQLSLPEVCSLSVLAAAEFFESLDLDETGQTIAAEVLKEIRGRLGFLLRCGLDYLALDRTAPTLSGGESQRIRLAGQIGCGLVGVVYILDEPSIGLHSRDNRLLLDSLCELRDQGNTVIVVEHDEETMRAADHIVDFGPGPGVRGGEIVAEGTLADIRREPRSTTGKYLSGKLSISVPAQRRRPGNKTLTIRGARHNNLQNIDVSFPLETFLCVTGVSGSGKSSLVNDILWQVLNRELNKGRMQGGCHPPGDHDGVKGLKHLDKAIDINQSPIGRTPRSNPATYVKLFDLIRRLFTQLPESRVRGYKPGRFSFNVASGRCEACEGHGSNKLEMDFLADLWVECPVCEGHRFKHETLEVRYKGASIADVLEMDVQEALDHFRNMPKIVKLLKTLHDVGLDYLKLGQPSPTLSGGEAQRIKLARELGKRSTGRTIYLLDEPTTGLHFDDIEKLLQVLHGFVDAGNTVLVVEHNLDVVKTADWIIDLGPEGGEGGGTIVAEGPPETIAGCADSYTGRALAEVLSATKRKGRRRAGRNGRNQQAILKPPLAENDSGRAKNRGNGKLAREIVVRDAHQHNLQHIDVAVPRDKLSVFCGPSGSGKSSLAMDTLYAEGQRRYVESLSAYARQFLGQMPKPRVEHIHGLSPAIAIEQKNTGQTPRSTVGTVTEIYDYLRILYARLGTLYCPGCNIPVETQTTDEVIDKVLAYPPGTKLAVLAPQEVHVGQKYEALWERLQSQGFLRVRVDGETFRLDDVPAIDRRRKHEVAVVVDRLSVAASRRSRLADSIEAALDLGRGVVHVARCDESVPEPQWPVDRYSLHFACQQCGRSFEELTPHSFSFNSSLGWCPACEGLGTQQGTNPAVLIADEKRTLAEGAISAWPAVAENATFRSMLTAMAKRFDIPLDVPYDELDPLAKRMVLHGTGDTWIPMGRGSHAVKFQYKGLYPAVEEASRVSYVYRQKLADLVGEVACSSCQGSRLRDDAAAVRLTGGSARRRAAQCDRHSAEKPTREANRHSGGLTGGSARRRAAASQGVLPVTPALEANRHSGGREKTLQQVGSMPLGAALDFFNSIRLSPADQKVAGDLLHEIRSRLSFLVEVGLDYLTLSRPLPTLSGGETQRIRLAGQIGRALTGVLYVLDEPTIGLHPRDHGRLMQALGRLRDLGNTVLLVEHDRDVLTAADRLFDFGPGAGRFGGTVTAQGTPRQLSRRKQSLTGQYLANKKTIPVPENRRLSVEDPEADGPARYNKPPGGGWLELLGARQHNLRNVDLRIPLGTLTCMTGVSGSGKSSLIEDTLAKAAAKRLHRSAETPAPHDELLGLERVNKVIVVDQQPLGNTPASNPATYTGVFDHIRELFARLPDAKVRGYQPARFSFNRPGGRCDDCAGNGQKCIEMHFLPDVWIECDTCHGKRYNQETLAVRYRGKSIADVLEMSIGQALELFENIPKIRGCLATLSAIGLEYLTLGQPAPTLSGGEAQRVKLAAELARPNTGRTLYLLDEPTTGLHFDDIDKLLKVLSSLVELGNTVVVVEHNLDVIKTADYIVDLGPEAGHEGGYIVASGTPEEIVTHAERYETNGGRTAGRKTKRSASASADVMPSHTAAMLAPVLQSGRRERREAFDARAASRKRSGDIDLREIGRNAKMPWQSDGRGWHTRDRVGYNGQPCRWEGAALEWLVDELAETGEFAAPNWNHRTVVELMGAPKQGGRQNSGRLALQASQPNQFETRPTACQTNRRSGGWFLHALTGDEWLLTLKFRVRKNTFDADELRSRLELKPIDDIDELPVYGRSDRVRVKNLKGPWQEVAVTVHWLREIDTPAFREFLKEACRSYLAQIHKAALNPDDLTPWKVLGRKWHLLRKGFPSGKRVAWDAAVLEKLFNLLQDVLPDGSIDWGNKQVVYFRPKDGDKVWAAVHTKRRGGIDLSLFGPPGKIALGRIAQFGRKREILRHSDGRDIVKIRFDTVKQVESPALKKLLAEHLE